LNNAELRKWKMPSGGRLKPEWVAGFTGIRMMLVKVTVKISFAIESLPATNKYVDKINTNKITLIAEIITIFLIENSLSKKYLSVSNSNLFPSSSPCFQADITGTACSIIISNEVSLDLLSD